MVLSPGHVPPCAIILSTNTLKDAINILLKLWLNHGALWALLIHFEVAPFLLTTQTHCA